jgi:drug/metabolite transporter (DMT)-like permease
MSIFNQYSAVWLAIFVVVITGFILLRRKPKWPQFLAFGILLIGLVAAWIILHPRQSTQTLDAAQVQASIGHGKYTLLEFQSPY